MRIFLAAIAVLTGIAGCTPKPAARPADTLVIARYFNGSTLDPAVGFTSNDFALIDEIYEQLFDIAEQPAGAKVVGELARAWTVSDDGLTIDIELHTDRRFVDGSPVDAEAVAYSLQRVLAVGRGPASYLDWLERAEATAPTHVRLILKRPFAPALELLTLSPASIVNPRVVRANDHDDHAMGWLADQSAGSGPYQILRHRSAEETVLTANPHSGRQPRQFKRVIIRAVPDEGVRRLLLERGDADIADPVPAALVSRYRALTGVTTATERGGTSLSFLVLNTERPALRDVAIRQAIAKAIDYDSLRRLILKDNAIQVAGYLPPGAPGFDAGEAAPRRDLPGARELLRHADYDDTTTLVMLVGQLGPVAEFIQSNLRDAGINVTLQRIAPSALAAARANGTFDLLYDGWALDVPDPVLYLDALFASRNIGAGTNMSRYRNAEMDALIDQAYSASDDDARSALFQAMDAILRRDRPLVMIFGANPVVASREDIRGLRIRRLRPLYTCFECLWREPPPPDGPGVDPPGR